MHGRSHVNLRRSGHCPPQLVYGIRDAVACHLGAANNTSLKSTICLLVQKALFQLHQGQLLEVPRRPQWSTVLHAVLHGQCPAVVLLGDDERSCLDIMGDVHPQDPRPIAHDRYLEAAH